MGAEPRLGLVCQAITDEWLRPLLEAENDPDAADVIVWFDTAALRSSSNKAASALEAFKEGLISAEAARRELGFTESDAPEDADEAGQQDDETPDTTEGEDLPVDTTQEAPATQPGADTVTASAMLAPALTAAVDGVVWSALTAAGQKIMRTPACPRPDRGRARDLAASAAVHTRHPVAREDIAAWRLLDGAWVRVPEIAQRYGVDGDALTAALDEYASALLITGQSHVYENVTRMLAQSGILPSTLIGMVAK
jgi:hypothetical protein